MAKDLSYLHLSGSIGTSKCSVGQEALELFIEAALGDADEIGHLQACAVVASLQAYGKARGIKPCGHDAAHMVEAVLSHCMKSLAAQVAAAAMCYANECRTIDEAGTMAENVITRLNNLLAQGINDGLAIAHKEFGSPIKRVLIEVEHNFVNVEHKPGHEDADPSGEIVPNAAVKASVADLLARAKSK